MNTIRIFGLVIEPIHIQIAQFIVVLAGGIGGAMWLWLRQKWAQRGNRQMDHYLDTIHEITDPDEHGYRTLKIRLLGGVERVETVVRGRKEREWLLAAAFFCDWTRRFIKDANPEHQARIYHVLRNTIGRHFAPGFAARLAKLPHKAFDLFYSATGADAAVGGVRMIRNILATQEQLEIVYLHPKDKWKFENDMNIPQSSHTVRIETLWQMAEALLKHGGMRRNEHGEMVKIVGWLEAVVPA